MYKNVIILIFLVFMPLWILAKDKVVIKGEILNFYTNKPVPYVNIAVKGTFQGTYSDTDGNFQIKLPKQDYILEFYHVSFYNKSVKVHVENQDTMFIKVTLKEKTEQLGVIDVEAPRETALSHYILNSQSIRNAPAIGEPDALRAVAMLPGIQIANDYKAQPTIRGGSSDQTGYLLDGVEIYYPQHFRGIFSAFNIWALENVNVYTSYIPAQHLGRLSGIISCNTPRGNFVGDKNLNKNKMHANISLLSSSFEAQSQRENNFFALAVRRTYLDFITSAFKKNLPYYFYDGDFKWAHKLSKKSLVSFLFYKGRDRAKIDVSNISWGNQLFKLDYTYTNRAFLQKLSASHSEYSTQAFDNNDNRIDNQVRNLRFRYRIRKILPRNLSELGTEIKHVTVKHSWALNDDVNPGKLFYSGAPNLFFKSQKATLFRTYFTNSFIIKKEKLFLDSKISGTMFNSKNLYASGGFKLDYKINKSNGLSLSAEKNTQFIAAGAEGIELSMNSPLFLLNSGMSLTQFTFGGYTDIIPYISAKMEIYNKNFDKIVRLNRTSTTFPDFEWGKGRAYGIDLLLEKRTGRITFQLGYSAIQNYLIFNGKKYFPNWFIPHSFKSSIGFRFGQTWMLSASTTYRSGLLYAKPIKSFFAGGENGNSEYDNFDYSRISEYFVLENQPTSRFSPYFRLDISIRKEYKVKNFKWYLYFQIFNATNHTNPLRVNWTKYYSHGSIFNENTLELNMPFLPSIGAEFIF